MIEIAAALSQRGISRGIVSAGVLADLTGIYVSYAVCLVASLAITAVRKRERVIVLIAALAFVLFALGMTVFAITLEGRRAVVVSKAIARLRFVRSTLDFIRDAEPRLARNRAALLQSSACHLAILFCELRHQTQLAH